MGNTYSTQENKQLTQQPQNSLLEKTILHFEYNEKIARVRAKLHKKPRSKK